MSIRRKTVRPRGSTRAEIFRKTVHAAVGVVTVLLVQARLLDLTLLGILTIFILALILFNIRYERELLTRLLSVNRPDASIPGLDLVAYFAGMWLVLALFPQHLAFAAIMVLAFGDPFAHLMSRSFGGTSAVVTPHSYWYGVIAGTLAGTLAASLYVPFLAALLASAAAMAIEAGEIRVAEHHIDDNLTIPLVAGIVLWVINHAVAL